MSTSDDYMTPPYAWENIARFLPKDKVCYEPFYGDGKSGEVLRGLGLEVIHEDTDFFTNTYDFDYICTNPPFSKMKEIFAELKAIGKPFVLLCPCTTLTTKYFSKHFADEIQIIVPPRRIHFEKLVDGKPVENYKSRCNFDCLYYCWKMNLPRDLVWLTAYSASTADQ